MAVVNDKADHYQTITITCYTANIAYLILRAFYLVLFLVSGLYAAAWVDAATILVYFLFFLLLKKRKFYIYALACGNEFFAFIITMTLLVGFASGFHFYLIGLCVVSFFTSYFSKQKNIKGSIVWAGLSVIIYLVLYFVTAFNAPYYVIDKWMEMTLMVTHIVLVFLFVVFYLMIFVRYALSLESKIMNESRTDELTQMNNRYALYDYFSLETDKSSKVLALFDIDDFKKINDVHGHNVGDVILKRVAEITTSVLSDAFTCRYGGEEFVVVLDENGYLDRLEDLRGTIENETFTYRDLEMHITITIGVAHYAKDMRLDKWVELADGRMYSGKKSGKNKTVS